MRRYGCDEFHPGLYARRPEQSETAFGSLSACDHGVLGGPRRSSCFLKGVLEARLMDVSLRGGVSDLHGCNAFQNHHTTPYTGLTQGLHSCAA
eukprot:5724717-Prymnesium_polylepis.1